MTRSAITTSQGTPKNEPLPMKANGRSALKTVVSLPISRARPRTAVSDPSVTMKGGSRTKAIEQPLTRPKPGPISRAAGMPSRPKSGISDAISATMADGGEDRADRQVDAAGQDDEGHAGRRARC